MKKMLKHHISTIALLGLGMCMETLNIHAAASTSSAQFLKLGAGARATAMGDAFISIADDVTATYWNPAGLMQLQRPEISMMQNSGLVETQYQYLGAAFPYRDSALGISLYRLDDGSIDRYTVTDVKDGSFTAGSLAGSVTLATKINGNLMIGFSGKYIQESLESERATSFAGDAGMLYKMGRFNFGGTVQHLGPGLKMVKDSSPLPLTIRLGASTRLLKDQLLVAIDASKPNDNDLTLHGGIEYRLFRMLSLRGGYNVTPGQASNLGGLAGLTGGLGIRFNRFNVDYAVSPFGDLGISQSFSLLVQFATQD